MAAHNGVPECAQSAARPPRIRRVRIYPSICIDGRMILSHGRGCSPGCGLCVEARLGSAECLVADRKPAQTLAVSNTGRGVVPDNRRRAVRRLGPTGDGPIAPSAGLVFAWLAAACAGILAIVLRRLATRDQVQAWARTRSVSEAVKAEVYTYLAGGRAIPRGRQGHAVDRETAGHRRIGQRGETRSDQHQARSRELPPVRDVASYITERVRRQIDDYYVRKLDHLQDLPSSVRGVCGSQVDPSLRARRAGARAPAGEFRRPCRNAERGAGDGRNEDRVRR